MPDLSPRALPSDAASVTPRVPARLRAWALVLAVASGAAVLVAWKVFVASRLGQLVEDVAYDGALVGRNHLWTLAQPVLGVVSVGFVVVGASTAVGIALVRRRWALAVQVVAVIVGSNLTTQVLKKSVLDRPSLGTGSWWNNSLPSGHTTVAASVSVALVLAVPRAARPAVAVCGALYTAATGTSTLVGQWHRPSDVIAAVLVVAVWGALACLLTTGSATDPARPVADPRSGTWAYALLGLTTLVGGGVAVAALLRTASLVDSGSVVSLRDEVTAYAGGVAAVGAATALVFGLLLALRQAVARPLPGPQR